MKAEDGGGGGGQGEWLLQSPLHVAAYSGDKEALLSLLTESKSSITCR